MKLSIILPVYNGAKTLDECLKSIFEQDFSKKDFEVLFIDGGSKDRSLEIAKKYPLKIVDATKLKGFINNEEFKKIWGINNAKGKVLAFIDCDNVLLDKNWIKKMLTPFEEDKNIFFADTLYYSYRKKDLVGVKYQALIGGDDPIIGYLGAYSRWNYLKDDWTDYPHKDENKKEYIKSKFLDIEKIPPMGSNGFLVRTELARKYITGETNSFVHSDFVYYLIKKNYNCFAKVKTGLIHNQPKFFPNKIRRIKRKFNKEIKIKYNYGITNKKIIKTILYICLIVPVIFDTLKGFIKKPCSAWFFHPIACFGELFLFGYYFIKEKLKLIG